MNSIFDVVQSFIINDWSISIYSTIVDILFVLTVIYGIYHMLVLVKDCFGNSQKTDYKDEATKRGTSASTEYKVDKTGNQDLLETVEMDQEGYEDLMTDDSNIYYSRGVIPIGFDEYPNNETLGNVKLSSNQTTKKSAIPAPVFRPIDEGSDSFLAGSGARHGGGNKSILNASNETTANAQLSIESGDGIFSLDYLSTAQPIAHSSPLRK